MSKEKQIEEMAEDIRYARELVLDHDVSRDYQMARILTNKGYRKQSEGEWLVKWRSTFPQYEPSEYECSICGCKRTVLHNYCPNCGAKMKGSE